MSRSNWVLACSMFLMVAVLTSAATAQVPPQPTETAFLSGELNDGDVIPLPVFAEGDTASEDQCHWIVSARTFFDQYDGFVYCYTTGRTVHVLSEGGFNNPATVANYMIVAARQIPAPTTAPPAHRIVAFNGLWAVDSNGNVYDQIFPTTSSACDSGALTTHLLGNMFGGVPPSPIADIGDVRGPGLSVVLENGDLYYWCTYNTPPPGYAVRAGNIFSAAGISAVGQPVAPAVNGLSVNRPNPFNPATEIPYRVGSSGQVLIQVFDPAGRVVRNLENVRRSPGQYVARWDGRTDAGMNAASGVYFSRITYPDGTRSEGKMTIAR